MPVDRPPKVSDHFGQCQVLYLRVDRGLDDYRRSVDYSVDTMVDCGSSLSSSSSTLMN